ncbi:MAG: hypothetical protein ABIG10_00605 [bacterium]
MKKSLLLIALLLICFNTAKAEDEIADRLSGKTLVAAESHGEIWYVSPETKERHYLGKPADFLTAMRKLALGVSKKDFDSFNGKAPKRLSGKFLLLVGENGKIAYVNPKDLSIYKFNNVNEAIETIKGLSLGINNVDLNKISLHNAVIEENNADDNSLIGRLKKIAEDFVNNNLLQEGNTAIVESIKPVYGLYELKIKISNRDDLAVSYISNDGKKFFPQALDIIDSAPAETNNSDNNTQDKPIIELFVMSHCPYGTQMEKGILPAVKALGDSIDFNIKFVDYIMHGKKEIDEQLNQYCIQEEQTDKFIDYLNCFLKAGDGEACLAEINIDTDKLKICVSNADEEYGISAGYEDDSTWLSGRYPEFNIHKSENTKYDVSGSPTLILNGEKVSTGRDSDSLLATICNGFITKPAACNQSISSSVPGPGFGAGTSDSSAGGCGS